MAPGQVRAAAGLHLPHEWIDWTSSVSLFDSGYVSSTCYASVTEFATSDPEIDSRRNCGFSAVAAYLQGRRHPVVTLRQIHMVQTVQHITEIPQFLVGKVIDVPVVQVERAPHVPSWRRQSCSSVDRFMRHEARS